MTAKNNFWRYDHLWGNGASDDKSEYNNPTLPPPQQHYHRGKLFSEVLKTYQKSVFF